MTTAGWIFMLTAWAVIIGVLVACYVRTLSSDDADPDESTPLT